VRKRGPCGVLTARLGMVHTPAPQTPQSWRTSPRTPSSTARKACAAVTPHEPWCRFGFADVVPLQPRTCACVDPVFGPVCIVEPFTDFKAVIDKVNDSKFGLQAGVFTNDLQKVVEGDGRGGAHAQAACPADRCHTHARFAAGAPPGQSFYAFEHLEVGGVVINDVPSVRIDSMPYGGVKDSGIGREGVRYGAPPSMRDCSESSRRADVEDCSGSSRLASSVRAQPLRT